LEFVWAAVLAIEAVDLQETHFTHG